MRNTLFLAFVFVTQLSMAQLRVEGTLKTKDGKAVSHASVTIRNVADRIVAFKPSDVNGYFSIDLLNNIHSDSIRLQVNHLGYSKIDILLIAGQSRYDFILEEKPIDLSEITIQNRPRIDSYGDTLGYNINSFAHKDDRSIGDVLSRMPGMEVSESGQIKFNGKEISNFYIDGDDLLDNRYSIGTKTIPHNMVQRLEVMQNHQPMKVLRNKTMSDQVAINLVIRDDAKLKMTGQAKMGAGLPKQYDGELNSILFNKKYKMLNVVKGNNIGQDLASDLNSFGLSSMLSGAGNARPQALLSGSTAGVPGLPKSRYYKNNSGSLNFNNMMNLSNGLQMKTNIGGLLDRNFFTYQSQNYIFLSGDTIRYQEIQQSSRNPFQTDINLVVTQNKDHYYFNNSFKFVFSGQGESSIMQNNEIIMKQSLANRVRDFSNTFSYVPELKNQHIISVNWYLNHYNRPEHLTITPGVLTGLLNDGNEYSETSQWAETPTWFNSLSIGYRMPTGKIMQNYMLAITNEWQDLHSQLRISQNDDAYALPFYGSDDNDLSWRRHLLSLDGNYQYKAGRFESTLNFPISLQSITYKDPGFNLSEKNARVLFNPRFSLKYKTTVEDYLVLNYSFNNQTGNINGVFRGVVLHNYRSIGANDAGLQERSSLQWDMNYHFQRAIQMLFMNAGLSYSKSMANTITTRMVSEDISRSVLLPFDNNIRSFSANAGISKYIFALGATASLKSSWSTHRINQIINDQVLPYANRSLVVNPAVEAPIFHKINLNYSATGSWTTSYLVKKSSNVGLPERQVQQYQQSLALSYSPLRQVFLRISANHLYTKQPGMEDIQYYFVDAFLRKYLVKWRTDVEFNLTNLMNVRTFETYSLTANEIFHSKYELRGRMAVLKVIFNL